MKALIVLVLLCGIQLALVVGFMVQRTPSETMETQDESFLSFSADEQTAPPVATQPFQERMRRLASMGTTETHPIPKHPDIVVHETKQAPLTIPPGTFEERLLHFAREYESYGLADRAFAWSMIDCLIPGGPRLRASQS